MISVAIQHHPARAQGLARVLERVPEAEVVSDPEPDAIRSPQRGYLECLRTTPAGATHRIVLQDDTLPCVDFMRHAGAAIAEQPDTLIAFFVPGSATGGMNRVKWARKKGERWANVGGVQCVPVVALSWPVSLFESYFAFCELPRQINHRCDDEVVTRFTKRNKLPVWATIPSLVEHPDDIPSSIGKRHTNGSKPWRIAYIFAEHP